jgi:hypothetical protein
MFEKGGEFSSDLLERSPFGFLSWDEMKLDRGECGAGQAKRFSDESFEAISFARGAIAARSGDA